MSLGLLVLAGIIALGGVVLGLFAGEQFPVPADRRAMSDLQPRCSGPSARDHRCHERRYRALAVDDGAQAALAELGAESKQSGFVADRCHGLAHVIGRAGAPDERIDPDPPPGTFRFCEAGYQHGRMEALVARVGAAKILEEPDATCAERRSAGRRSIEHHNCAHGLGHGFMRSLGNEVFRSLDACGALADPWEREQCGSGVFMAMDMAAAPTPRDASEEREVRRPFYPCTAVASQHKRQCYVYRSTQLLRARGNDFIEAFSLCAQAPEEGRAACYQGLGEAAGAQSVRDSSSNAGEANQARTLCMLGGNDDARSGCVVGAARQLTLQYDSAGPAKAFCEALSRELRVVCGETREQYYIRRFRT